MAYSIRPLEPGFEARKHTIHALRDGVTRLSGGDIKQFTHSIFLVVHTPQSLGFTLYASLSSWGMSLMSGNNASAALFGGIVPD